MRARRLLPILIAAWLALLLPAGAQESTPPAASLGADAPPYALHGPYWVGTRDFVIEDQGRSLPVTVWYPALNPEGKPEEITYTYDFPPPMPVTGHALLDAPADGDHGPYPLVVFSHGLWTYRLVSLYYTEHLASYGFVVIAPDHVGDTWKDTNGPSWQAFFILRPLDITRVIDYAGALTASGGAMPGLIDMDRVAVTGHSFGGFTALAAAPGAQLDLRPLRALCDSGQDVLNLCKDPPSLDELAALAGLDSVPDGPWPSLGDPRVDTIVALAPADVRLTFGSEGLSRVIIPALVMSGSKDTVIDGDYLRAYRGLGSAQKALAVFDGADHYVYQNACAATPWLLSPPYTMDWFCSDPAWDMDRAHDLTNHFATAFLLAVLKGDEAAAVALAPDQVSFSGIAYRAAGF
jgi:predicted dienelactone hydrolase